MTRRERQELTEHRREMSAWRVWFAKSPDQQAVDRLRSLALEKAAFALCPIMEREGLEDLQMIAAGELARVAIDTFEAVMRRGLTNPAPVSAPGSQKRMEEDTNA